MQIESEQLTFKNQDWHQIRKQLKQAKLQQKNQKSNQLIQQELGQTFGNKKIEAPLSQFPTLKICDVTGFPSQYRDKSNGMQYADQNVFQHIQEFNQQKSDSYISLRKQIQQI